MIRFQPTIQFPFLFFGEWNSLWHSRNAVSYIFDHLNPLLNAEIENICGFCTHKDSRYISLIITASFAQNPSTLLLPSSGYALCLKLLTLRINPNTARTRLKRNAGLMEYKIPNQDKYVKKNNKSTARVQLSRTVNSQQTEPRTMWCACILKIREVLMTIKTSKPKHGLVCQC